MIRLAIFLSLLVPAVAQAADITVFAGGSMVEPLRHATAGWAKANGHVLHFSAGTTGVMLGKIRGGEAVDVVVISAEAVEALEKEGRVAPGSRKAMANAILGVGIKAGADRPDISTVEAFRKTMIEARSIGFPDPALGATSGVYLQSLFDKLGIGAQMRSKTVVKPVGAAVAAAAAQGEVELAVTFVSEMEAQDGLTIVGTLPAEILNPTPYSAGVSSTARAPAAARAFVAYVTSAAAAPALKAAGVDPVAFKTGAAR